MLVVRTNRDIAQKPFLEGMDLAIAYVPHVPTRIAQYRQYEFLYRPVSAIANAQAKLASHDPTFDELFCRPMTPLDRRRWASPEQAVIGRRIGPDAMRTARTSGAALGMLYVYTCLADAIEERWRDEPATFILLPRYGPHHDAVLEAFTERTLNEGALRRLAPDLAQGVELLASAHGIDMIKTVAQAGYGALLLCAKREPYVPIGDAQ